MPPISIAPCPGLVDGEPDDLALLRRYVDTGSQAAFAEIVKRHLPWIYQTCRKALRDPHLAEDAAQAVFIILGKRAPEISDQTRISGWLFNTARFVVKDVRKQESRYRRRQDVAQGLIREQLRPTRPGLDHGTQAALDDALATLTERDRGALVMHFYEGLSLTEMAEALGIGKEGAKKRVARALARLRTRMGRKKSIMSIGLVVMLLKERSAQALPQGLARAVIHSATIPGTAGATSQLMAMEAMRLAMSASNRLMRAVLASQVVGAVAMVGWWGMAKHPASGVAVNVETPSVLTSPVAKTVTPAAPAPKTPVTTFEEAEPGDSNYHSGAFEKERAATPLPPFPKTQAANAANTEGDLRGSGGGGIRVLSNAFTPRPVNVNVASPTVTTLVKQNMSPVLVNSIQGTGLSADSGSRKTDSATERAGRKNADGRVGDRAVIDGPGRPIPPVDPMEAGFFVHGHRDDDRPGQEVEHKGHFVWGIHPPLPLEYAMELGERGGGDEYIHLSPNDLKGMKRGWIDGKHIEFACPDPRLAEMTPKERAAFLAAYAQRMTGEAEPSYATPSLARPLTADEVQELVEHFGHRHRHRHGGDEPFGFEVDLQDAPPPCMTEAVSQRPSTVALESMTPAFAGEIDFVQAPEPSAGAVLVLASGYLLRRRSKK